MNSLALSLPALNNNESSPKHAQNEPINDFPRMTFSKPIPAPSLFLSVSLLLLTGCASAPDQQSPPNITLPEHWSAATLIDSTKPQAWLEDFQSPQLIALIDEALAHNADLQLAAARLDQSISEARIAGADPRPQLALGLNGQRQKISTFGPTSTAGIRFDNYDFGLNLNWELDLWGRLRNRNSAALAQVAATQAEFEGARLSLAAQVSKRWFNSLEAHQQLQLAESTARAYSENLNAIEARFKRGISSGVDLSRIRTQNASAQAQIAARQRALDGATRALEVLLGRYPDASVAADSDMLPDLPRAIPAGIPAQLLQRRPDLIAAERKLAAVDQELRAANKDRLPRISLTASGGSSSQEFQELLDSDFSVWSLGANLTQPLFQGGRIAANIDRTQAQVDQARAHYRATALQAFLEVEATLAAEKFLQEEYARLAQSAEEAHTTETLAWQRYRNGSADFLQALDAQRTADQARSQLLRLRNSLLQNRIDLYLALGGPFYSAS